METTKDQNEARDVESREGESAPCYPADSVGGMLHKMMIDSGLWPHEADANKPRHFVRPMVAKYRPADNPSGQKGLNDD